MAAADELMGIYRETVEPLYRFVSCRVGASRELAEDITQETYLRAFRSWRAGQVPEVPLAWLQVVARNLLLNHFKRRRPTSVATQSLDGLLAPSASHEPDHVALIQWGLARIRTSWAIAIEAYHLDGKSVAAIASELGLSERAIEGRLRRGRAALRRKLAPHVTSSGTEQ